MQIEAEIAGIIARLIVLANQILSMLLEVYLKSMVHMEECIKENRSNSKQSAKSRILLKRIQQDHKLLHLLVKKSVRVADIHKPGLIAKPKIKMKK